MDSFSISDLAQYSGIKAHTIRIWEKRYQALKPNRSIGNTRYYDSAQLKRLLNISGLLHSDYKVSELCTMPDEKLQALTGNNLNAKTNASPEYFISQLIAAALTYDEPYFVNIFSHCLLKYGMKDAYLLVLYPALIRIGLMWLSSSIDTSSEHFISNLIRQKLFTAIDSLPIPRTGSPTWILFLPENEFHEIGLLMANYLIRLSGQKVIYLGGNVPETALLAAIQDVQPENLLMFFVHRVLPVNIKKYLDRLSKVADVKKIYIAVNQTLGNQLKSGKKLIFLNSVEELDRQLTAQTV